MVHTKISKDIVTASCLRAEELAARKDAKRCRIIHAHLLDVPLPKGDIVVSETLGNYILEDGIIDTMNDGFL